MTPLSATDAITPAWQHARQLLLGPRNTRLLFKLTAIAFFAQIGGCNFSYDAPNAPIHSTTSAITAGVTFLLIFSIVAAVTVMGLAFFYLSSRLQFVLFHFVLRSETWIAPIWRHYAAATWRWIGLKLLFALAAIVCIVPLALPVIFFFIRATHQQQTGGGHVMSFVFAIIVFVLIVLLIVLAIAIAFVLLRDFGLPSMALEATPLRETVRRVIALARAELGQVVLYLVMRFVLGLAGTMAAYIALLILGLVAAIPLGGAGLGLWAALHQSSVGAHVVMYAGFAVLAVILVAALIIASTTLFGYLFTFLQAYAIFFLAGRYPLLAERLASPLSPPPQSWSFAPWKSGLYTPPPA
jgi:hypothetical protein